MTLWKWHWVSIYGTDEQLLNEMFLSKRDLVLNIIYMEYRWYMGIATNHEEYPETLVFLQLCIWGLLAERLKNPCLHSGVCQTSPLLLPWSSATIPCDHQVENCLGDRIMSPAPHLVTWGDLPLPPDCLGRVSNTPWKSWLVSWLSLVMSAFSWRPKTSGWAVMGRFLR